MEYEYIKHIDGSKIKMFLVEINRRELHFHNDIEIFIVLKGSIYIDHVRERYTLHENDIFIVNKNVVHSLKKASEDNLSLVLQFSTDFCKEYYPKISSIRFRECYVSVTKDSLYWEALNHCIREMAKHYTTKKDGYTFSMMALLNTILEKMLEYDKYIQVSEKETASEHRNIKRLNTVISYIQNNYMHYVTLKDLAEYMNLDMYYLSHFIKERLGISFQKYVARLRLERAENLLLNTNLRNIDICIESGFSDYKYMSKAFFNEYQCTPTQYRQKNKIAIGRVLDDNEQHTDRVLEKNEQHIVSELSAVF